MKESSIVDIGDSWKAWQTVDPFGKFVANSQQGVFSAKVNVVDSASCNPLNAAARALIDIDWRSKYSQIGNH